MTEIVVSAETRRAFFSMGELARYLGVSPRTVRQMVHDGRIASYMFEGSRRIAADDVDAYVAARRQGRA